LLKAPTPQAKTDPPTRRTLMNNIKIRQNIIYLGCIEIMGNGAFAYKSFIFLTLFSTATWYRRASVDERVKSLSISVMLL